MNNNNATNSRYDVAICGCGLAGLTLARQLRLNYPELKIIILETGKFPRPVATFKVGESVTEIAAFYLSEVLMLKDYFVNAHFTKLGFRFILGDGKSRIEDRPEIGLSEFPPFTSYQIDRGILENDLFEINKLDAIEIIEQATIKNIHLKDSNAPHVIDFDYKGAQESVQADWVIDAMGRRLFLQRKLNLHKRTTDPHNSVWFRLQGRVDLDDMVGNDQRFRSAVLNKKRYYSTVHIMGAGYWVWIIPLASGNTSIGIVASQDKHSFEAFNAKQTAFQWLEKYEPVLGEYLSKFKMLDFLRMKDYSYTSDQVFSVDNWACVGEAAVFADPLYSVGSNLIGYENTCVTHMIGLYRQGKLTSNKVNDLNNFIIAHNEWLIDHIHSSYKYFGHPQVYTLAFLWSVTSGWALDCPQMFNSTYLEKKVKDRLAAETAPIISLLSLMKQLFQDWSACANHSFTFKYLDYLSISFIKQIYIENLKPNKTIEELIEDRRKSVRVLEEFSQVIFLLIVEDAFPDKFKTLVSHSWLNINAISLKADEWEKSGLFMPTSTPRDLTSMQSEMRGLFEFKLVEERVSAFNYEF